MAGEERISLAARNFHFIEPSGFTAQSRLLKVPKMMVPSFAIAGVESDRSPISRVQRLVALYSTAAAVKNPASKSPTASHRRAMALC